LGDIINIRYGATRRIADASPHLIELDAQAFTFCMGAPLPSSRQQAKKLRQRGLKGGTLHARRQQDPPQVFINARY